MEADIRLRAAVLALRYEADRIGVRRLGVALPFLLNLF
jgi:hypothetical protein